MKTHHVHRISVLTPAFVPYDAIGNDVAEMRNALRERGYRVHVFAETVHPERAAVASCLSKVDPASWQSPDDIIIYHHSTAWPLGEAILSCTKNKIIIRYHNITPAHFFEPYSPAFSDACKSGAAATKRLAELPAVTVLGDSLFNCQEFVALGIPSERCKVLPPLHLIAQLGNEPFDISTVQRYSGDTVTILFVGGIKPNKGHARAIRAFAAYQQHFDQRSRLVFAGNLDERLRTYANHLRDLAHSLGVSNSVVFTGPVRPSELKTLYALANVFLCTSEHEGFCVPLVEAMFFRTPIVAWGATAVPETLADSGLLFYTWDEFQCASTISRVVRHPELGCELGDRGRERYQNNFAPEILRRQLCAFVAEESACMCERTIA